ncbi:MAG: hypothetical protein KR126chlam3_01177 [Chlamydiae bacterium]|nr:hypothetical protein [Chlamydiota bacterium]
MAEVLELGKNRYEDTKGDNRDDFSFIGLADFSFCGEIVESSAWLFPLSHG